MTSSCTIDYRKHRKTIRREATLTFLKNRKLHPPKLEYIYKPSLVNLRNLNFKVVHFLLEISSVDGRSVAIV